MTTLTERGEEEAAAAAATAAAADNNSSHKAIQNSSDKEQLDSFINRFNSDSNNTIDLSLIHI